ncbi:MAG: hypothetical protein V1820_05325 [archaeon]
MQNSAPLWIYTEPARSETPEREVLVIDFPVLGVSFVNYKPEDYEYAAKALGKEIEKRAREILILDDRKKSGILLELARVRFPETAETSEKRAEILVPLAKAFPQEIPYEAVLGEFAEREPEKYPHLEKAALVWFRSPGEDSLRYFIDLRLQVSYLETRGAELQ